MSSQIVEVQPLEVVSFSGGMTDFPLSAGQDQFELGDNLNITDDGKMQTRSGIDSAYGANSRVSSGNRLVSLFDNNNEMLHFEATNAWSYNGTAWQKYNGVNVNNTWSAAASTLVSGTKWNSVVFACASTGSRVKSFYHNGTGYVYQNLGLPTPTAFFTFGGAGSTGGTRSFAYKCHFEYDYTSNGQQFRERSAVYDFPVRQNCKDVDASNPITITLGAAIQNLFTNPEDSYALGANLSIVFYRNAAGGTIWYRAGKIQVATGGVFTDTTTDTDLTTSGYELCYTETGVMDYEQPPRAKYAHMVDGVLYLGAVYPSTQWEDNLLQFSIQNMPYACPGSFNLRFDSKIRGISSVGSYPLVFTDDGIYRVEGRLDQFGKGSVTRKKISDKILAGFGSIIKLDDVVYFYATDGFSAATGQRAVSINSGLSKTTDSLNTVGLTNLMTGAFDAVNKRLIWLVPTSNGNNDARVAYVAHLKHGKGDFIPFTTYSGFELTDVYSFKNVIYFTDRFGHVLKLNNSARVDLIPETARTANDWNTNVIIYDFISAYSNFGSNSLKKWVPWIIINAANDSSLSLDIYSQNDQSGSFRKLSPLQYRGGISWGDPDVSWGDPNIQWNQYPMISAKRHFPSGTGRCMYKQVRFTNAEVDSILDGPAVTVDAANKTATVTNLPTDATGYKLVLPQGSFKVTKQVGNVLTLNDLSNALVNGTFAWKLSGNKKAEVLRLISFVIQYNFISSTQDPYFGGIK